MGMPFEKPELLFEPVDGLGIDPLQALQGEGLTGAPIEYRVDGSKTTTAESLLDLKMRWDPEEGCA